jgi:hypothetical protein
MQVSFSKFLRPWRLEIDFSLLFFSSIAKPTVGAISARLGFAGECLFGFSPDALVCTNQPVSPIKISNDCWLMLECGTDDR